MGIDSNPYSRCFGFGSKVSKLNLWVSASIWLDFFELLVASSLLGLDFLDWFKSGFSLDILSLVLDFLVRHFDLGLGFSFLFCRALTLNLDLYFFSFFSKTFSLNFGFNSTSVASFRTSALEILTLDFFTTLIRFVLKFSFLLRFFFIGFNRTFLWEVL
ncbi:unnamed protein product [Rhizophagus irregularis]|nr:unnamed protein product [Rhizophagus irregularis]CAB4444967.1 unnamed protein product [Rhizophagus irregularis]